jgi:hypothetical protein
MTAVPTTQAHLDMSIAITDITKTVDVFVNSNNLPSVQVAWVFGQNRCQADDATAAPPMAGWLTRLALFALHDDAAGRH